MEGSRSIGCTCRKVVRESEREGERERERESKRERKRERVRERERGGWRESEAKNQKGLKERKLSRE